MNLAVIGTGYVGLVSGVLLAKLGHKVTCIDINVEKIAQLQQGKIPIYEPGLDQHLNEANERNKITFEAGYGEYLQNISAIFICVGTPPREDGGADLTAIFSSLDGLIEHISDDIAIIVKSTVPPGTCKAVESYLREKGKSNPVASNPEFLREGSAVVDFLEPDRIVVGFDEQAIASIMKEIYKPLTDTGKTLFCTDLNTSELIKYASNTFLANKIAFINEMSDLCETIGANVKDLSCAVGLDKRIGKDFLKPGPGFGGSCFPKDILALQKISRNVDSEFLILDAIVATNKLRPMKMLRMVQDILGSVSGEKIAILGLTYKANTDDLRSSPSLALIELLQAANANISAYDPMGGKNAGQILEDLKIADNAYDACEGAKAVIVMTEWDEFLQLDFTKIAAKLSEPNFIDLRNFIDQDKVHNSELKYYTIGQKH